MNKLIWKNNKTFLFIAVIYLILFYRAFFTFNPSFDYLWYHLPLALTHFGRTTLVLTGFEKSLLDALPPLAHLTQGALATLFHQPRLGNSVNSVAFLLVLGCLWKLRKASLPLVPFLLIMAGIPLFVAQLYSGFIDVYGNLWLFLAFVSYFDLLQKSASRQNIFFFILGSVFATLSKYQMWPVVGFIYLMFLWEIARTRKPAALLAVLIGGLLIAVWPVRNLIEFGNPTHPYLAPGLSFMKKDSNVSIDTTQIASVQLYEGYQKFPRPVLFLMSAFEVTRLVPNPSGMQWTYEQWAMRETKNPHYRMGGWSFFTVFLLLSMCVLSYRKKQFPRKAYAVFAGATFLVSVLPQSHELRYYLFIPFVAAFIAAEFWPLESSKNQKRWRAAFLVSAVLVLCSRAFVPYEIQQIEDVATAEQKAFWDNPPPNSREHPVCMTDQPNRLLLWAGPDFNKVWIQQCK